MPPPPAHEMKSRLTVLARQLGFADCRIARVRGPAAHAAEFRQWVAEGSHGDMAWMARNVERRSDPREVLAGVQSAVVVALNYFQGAAPPDAEALGGRIARYAWGDDYHDLMDARLLQMARVMEEWGGVQKLYVDTGPVLERDWASTAGLGWNGKSTVQIHRQLGAWFFLGEILTSLDLEPDAGSKDHCGSCTRCMTACPTGAIDRARHVDARRCLSYLTIEHKGSIPEEFRRALGDRIYGCDECLEVCPWNRFAQISREAGFAAKPFVHGWRLRDFLSLTDETFRELFRGSPIKRIKRPAFLRNVCVALGNVGGSNDLAALKLAATNPHPLIAEHAQWAVREVESRMEIS